MISIKTEKMLDLFVIAMGIIALGIMFIVFLR